MGSKNRKDECRSESPQHSSLRYVNNNKNSLKLNCRRFVRSFSSFKSSFCLESEDSCHNVVREATNSGIVILNRFVEGSTVYRNAVFGTFQLGLSLREIRIRFKVWIGFYTHR